MFGRPVIGAAVGGVVERVRHGVDGYTFPVRDADALADRIAEICGGSAIWRRMSEAIVAPPTGQEMFEAYERQWLTWKR